MSEFLTSDLHFNHKNILAYMPERAKLWATIAEMNAGLIERWNAEVSQQDTVYLLGDIAFSGITKTKELVSHLNGKIVLVKGNHDTSIKDYKWLDAGILEVHESLELDHYGIKLRLSHYPYAPDGLSDNEDSRFLNRRIENKGIHLLHGHLHSVPQNKIRLAKNNALMYDVGVDANNYSPILLDAVVKELLNYGKNHCT